MLKVIAAATGQLLVWGTVYALEGMTTRLPISTVRELATTSLWTLPWTLLFCSGIEDFFEGFRKLAVLWIGAIAALTFLYYFDRNTSLTVITKAGMPVLTVGVAILPHFSRRLRFLYWLASLAAGVAGAFMLYIVLKTAFSPATHFANNLIALMFVSFVVASVLTGVLAFSDMYTSLTSRRYA